MCKRSYACLESVQGSYVNMTADSELLSSARPHVEALLGALPAAPTGAAAEAWATTLPKVNEAILVPTQVRFPCSRVPTAATPTFASRQALSRGNSKR